MRSDFNKYKTKKSSWITFGILKSIKYRDTLYKSLKKTEIDTEEYKNKKQILNEYNSVLKKLIREAKYEHYHNEFNKYRKNMRKTWDTINNVIHKEGKPSLPDYFNINNSKVADPTTIADSFNSFFGNIGLKMSKEIKSDIIINYDHYLTRKPETNFNLSNINEEEVKNIISNLQSKNSTGHDDMSSKLVKRLI